MIKPRPFGKVKKLADAVMMPLMYLVSGTLKESPQRSHAWHNRKLSDEEINTLSSDKMVHCKGDTRALNRNIILFHIPILGGWREYVVVGPDTSEVWNAGWITADARDISSIPLVGPVRLLTGPHDTSFFGIKHQTGEQVAIKKVGVGKIGKGGSFAQLPLI